MQVAVYGMFFLSGAGALVFENVWFSQTGMIVGNSVWAAALVVGAFMAGLALGNAVATRVARRWTNLLRLVLISAIVYIPVMRLLPEVATWRVERRLGRLYGMLRETDRATLEASGEFLNWKGNRYPW